MDNDSMFNELEIGAFPPAAQEMIRTLREENAGYRAAATEATGALAGVQAELDSVRETYWQLADAHTRFVVALEAGIPAEQAHEFGSRLKGGTPDELREDAESVKALMTPKTSPAYDPTQGRGMGGFDPSGSPGEKEFMKMMKDKGIVSRH